MIYVNDDPKLGHISFVIHSTKIVSPEELVNPANRFHIIDYLKVRENSRSTSYGYSLDGTTVRSCIPFKDLSDFVLDHAVRTFECTIRGGIYVEFLGNSITRKYNSQVPYTYRSVPYIWLNPNTPESYWAGRAFYDTTSECYLGRTKENAREYIVHSRSTTVPKVANSIIDASAHTVPMVEILKVPAHWELYDYDAISFKQIFMGSPDKKEKAYFRALRLADYFFHDYSTSMAAITMAYVYDRQSVAYKRFNKFEKYREMTAEEVLLGFAVSAPVENRVLPFYASTKNYKYTPI